MRTKRTYLLGTSVLAGVLATSTAIAQEAPAQVEAGATEVTEIVVTGSRIRRDPATVATPIIAVSQEQLMSTGQATVIDYLATIPALSNSQIPSDTTGSGLNDGGLSLANLRSLGAGRTLTLVDGRRHVGSQAGSLAVDVDTVPRLLIQNVEIITGGASSVYGADAVSGVLNFVLKKDFEGLEIDANYGMINSNGEAAKRISAVIGHNFLDGRLNVYAHGEYELQDEVTSMDIDWLRRAPVLLGVDADPTSAAIGPSFDGIYDQQLFTGVVRLDRPRWGSLTIANMQRPSELTNPLVPNAACTGYTASGCYSVDPGKTWWFDGTNARLANFGERVGNTGASRPYNIGGDGESPSMFSTGSRVPYSESQRYQVGGTFHVSDNVRAFAEAKYVTENTYDEGQPTFFDVYLSDTAYGALNTNVIDGSSTFRLRYSDNAFLPQVIKDAIAGNTMTTYAAGTNNAPGAITGTNVAAPWARHTMFGPIRSQDNERELQRYVLGLEGEHDGIGFLKNISWDAAYTYGKVDIQNTERGVDYERFSFAADAVVDTAGIVNGKAGEVVCRVQLLNAMNLPMRETTVDADGKTVVVHAGMQDRLRGGDLRSSEQAKNSIKECTPLNIFGNGNQSAEALEYVDAFVRVRQQNIQENAVATVSGQLWDLWGAGNIGVALGAEWRKEQTEAIGRSRDANGRYLFLNGGPDMPTVAYESKELFGELSLPLFRDSKLGEYAEISGSYRWSDYTTVGQQDVFGVNLVYRPIQDITFKSSFNSSIRVPSLSENFSPYSDTYANSFVDPCVTSTIAGLADAEKKANRIANCTALAAARGLTYDFANATPTDDSDDYAPDYRSSPLGKSGGNPYLQPEESESFTFSVVLQPRFIPNLTVHADYYEIELNNVIAAVSAQTAANTCVDGPSLNAQACDTIFRQQAAHSDPQNKAERSQAFMLGGNSTYGAFIQGSINYAKRKVRGMDFGARYRIDAEQLIGRDWGRFDYSMNGSYLIEQTNFNNIEDASDFTEYAGTPWYPRVRLSSTLAWSPNAEWRVSWTADWQSSQDIAQFRNMVSNPDIYPSKYARTGDFMRNDLTVRWKAREDLTVRAGVTNIFDEAQAPWLGTTLYSNFDPYGRRFNIGLNYTPW